MRNVIFVQETAFSYDWIRNEDGTYSDINHELKTTGVEAMVCEDVLDYFIKKAIENRINKLSEDADYFYSIEDNYILVHEVNGDVTHVTRYDYRTFETNEKVA